MPAQFAFLVTALSRATVGEYAPSPAPPAADLILHAPDVAMVRDAIVALCELKVTHMNATSTWASDDLTRQVVSSAQNTTWVALSSIGANESETLGPIGVAQVQGALVGHLNFGIGHMNGTSTIMAMDLVRGLLESMEDITGISADDVVLVPGVPPEDAGSKEAHASADDDESTPLLTRGGSAYSHPTVVAGCIVASVAALVTGMAAVNARQRCAHRGGHRAYHGHDGHVPLQGDVASTSHYKRLDGTADAVPAGPPLAHQV